MCDSIKMIRLEQVNPQMRRKKGGRIGRQGFLAGVWKCSEIKILEVVVQHYEYTKNY